MIPTASTRANLTPGSSGRGALECVRTVVPSGRVACGHAIFVFSIPVIDTLMMQDAAAMGLCRRLNAR